MGKIVTPTYRVEYRDNLLAFRKTAPDLISQIDHKPVLSMAWREERPTKAALENWRKGYNVSYLPNGSNEHITKAYNIIPHIYFARIVRQRDNKVMCEVSAPAFEAV